MKSSFNTGGDSARKYSPICRQKFVRSDQASPVAGNDRAGGASTDMFSIGNAFDSSQTSAAQKKPRYSTRLTGDAKARKLPPYLEENEKLKARLKVLDDKFVDVVTRNKQAYASYANNNDSRGGNSVLSDT